MRRMLLFLALTFICISTARAERVEVATISDFDLSRYLGYWYEVARLDHHFERGMVAVTAEYTLRDDGKIDVENRGYSTKKSEWRSSTAVAKRSDTPNRLRVYFLPLISGQYNVAYVDSDYSVAVVAGGSTRYLWFLSRTPTITLKQRERMISVAEGLGYDISELIYVSQQEP